MRYDELLIDCLVEFGQCKRRPTIDTFLVAHLFGHDTLWIIGINEREEYGWDISCMKNGEKDQVSWAATQDTSQAHSGQHEDIMCKHEKAKRGPH